MHTNNAAYQIGFEMNLIYSSLKESIMLCKTGSELSNSSGIVLNVITYAIPIL